MEQKLTEIPYSFRYVRAHIQETIVFNEEFKILQHNISPMQNSQKRNVEKEMRLGIQPNAVKNSWTNWLGATRLKQTRKSFDESTTLMRIIPVMAGMVKN